MPPAMPLSMPPTSCHSPWTGVHTWASESWLNDWLAQVQGLTLRLTGFQCDQKLSVGNRNLELVASRQLTFFPLCIWNSKVNGLFLKENTKLPWTIVVKQSDNLTITIFTRRHIVSKPFHLATKIFRLVASWLP